MKQRQSKSRSSSMADHDHAGHRERRKERFRREGLDGFQPHEVLELLLYFGIPQGDTNPLAHQLIKRFGSFSQVLDASYEDLLTVPGIGKHTATLLTLIPPLCRYYLCDAQKPKAALLDSKAMAEYIRPYFVGATNECFYLISLNAQNQVLLVEKLAEGSWSEVIVYPALVVTAALKNRCRSVVLAHNHPGNSTKVTSSDIELTRTLIHALSGVGVTVIDHIIIAGEQYVSFAENGYIRQAQG